MFMKMISKEKDVNSIEERRQADARSREFYLIDPKTGSVDVRDVEEIEGIAEDKPGLDDPLPESPADEVTAFLAEKSAERFDYMADGMEVMVLTGQQTERG